MKAMRILHSIAVIAGVLVFAAGAHAMTGAGDAAGVKPGVLYGEFDPPNYGDVRVHVRSHKTRLLEVEINNAPLQCDDGTVTRVGWRLRGKIKRNGEFRLAEYVPPVLGYNVRRYYDFQGRFVNDHLAKGVYTVMLVSFQPSAPSCATEYPLPWHARR
ncbi:MAG: hypothetical protein QOI10_1552 [Solirubrobacterales bacterium]|jgi:hypothetical protein|nr:hypothetical protein [Solirubrobacterales bacterium]